MLKGVGSRIVSLVLQKLLISSLHVCCCINMSKHLLMLKVICIAAGRRIDSPRFREDENELKEECRKARVNYEGPRKNEDYLLESVTREEKEKAHNFTVMRRKRLRMRCKREHERERKEDDKRREIIWNKPCDGDPNRRQQHVCAVCDTVRIGSKKLTSMSKEELLSNETRIGLGAFQEHYGIELHPDLVRQYEREGLEGLLLSKRARKLDDGSVEVCESCKNSLRRIQESPPK